MEPILQSRSGRQNLKKLFEAWYEKRQMKNIYSPLFEGLLVLYLGFEWIQIFKDKLIGNGYLTDK
ncbi:hypothetical protein Ahy_B03g064741 [Arachis hypogaea]|uniref:Uncharacterized protein n=1 Tax=Arachis hypogaea TaxID=3818 RepID=A0A445A0A6_ARAHY|nr:hypothetical protein Ahy_B03g064741 [Arachis hypogaea]